MSETRELLMRTDRTDQTFSVIKMLNRLSVAQIRLKRAKPGENSCSSEVKELSESIHSLTDSVLLGEDVRPDLNIIDQRLTQFEQRIAIH